MTYYLFVQVWQAGFGWHIAPTSSAVVCVALCSAGQEANENQPLLLLRCLRGQAGPSLGLDELLHRCGTLTLTWGSGGMGIL